MSRLTWVVYIWPNLAMVMWWCICDIYYIPMPHQKYIVMCVVHTHTAGQIRQSGVRVGIALSSWVALHWTWDNLLAFLLISFLLVLFGIFRQEIQFHTFSTFPYIYIYKQYHTHSSINIYAYVTMVAMVTKIWVNIGTGYGLMTEWHQAITWTSGG